MKTLQSMFAAMLFLVAAVAWAAIDVNSASAEQLQSLDGIGEVKARAIVEYREANGAFESKEALQEVDGIGPATLQSIKGDISLGRE